MHRLFCIVIALLLASPAMGQGARDGTEATAWSPPIEPLTGLPLPMLEGERLFRYADGCQSIIDPGVPIAPSPPGNQIRWLGACRFGLIDGSGFIEATSPGAIHLTPFNARLGRIVKGTQEAERFYRNRLRDTTWTFDIYPTLAEATSAFKARGYLLPLSIPGTKSWSAMLGHVTWQNDREDVSETYWVETVPCPLPLEPDGRATITALLEKEGYSADSVGLLGAFCAPSFERLNRLRKTREWLSVPNELERTDFGYYNQLKVTRANRTGGGTTTEAEAVERWPCSEPANVGSCDAAWRPIFVRYQAIRDVERKRQAEWESAREWMISKLEAAFAEKRRQVAAKARPRSP